MKRSLRLFLHLSLQASVLGSTLATTAHANDDVAKSDAESRKNREAADIFDHAVRLFQARDYRGAALEFERAYALTGNFNVLYNIGEVRFELGHYASATTALEDYLRLGGQNVPEEQRRIAAARLVQLRARTATVRVVVNEADAAVSFNGTPVGTGSLPPRRVDAGELIVTARKVGFEDTVKVVQLAGGDETTVSVVLAAKSPTTVSHSDSLAPLTWMTWGLTGIFAVGTLALGISWVNADDAFDEKMLRSTTRSQLASAEDDVSMFRTLTLVAGGATLLAAGTATYLTLSSSSRTRPQTRIVPTLGGAQLVGTF